MDSAEPERKKGVIEAGGRSAEQAGQTVNVDLCFVPVEHVGPTKLPAVSGSSGHLVVERCPSPDAPVWPGQVFGQDGQEYAAAMQQYAHATLERHHPPHLPRPAQVSQATVWRQEWEGRAERHAVLVRRKQEDVAWQAAKKRYRVARDAYWAWPRSQRGPHRAQWRMEQAEWQQWRAKRQAQHQLRQQENQDWHQRNQILKTQRRGQTPVGGWLAVLVVTDNCTRKCYGLPLFAAGAKVTAQEVVQALQHTLPAELQFLISDQGCTFRNRWMDQLAQAQAFVHVLSYRHRPQTNGIAERFVRTLKQWLRQQVWLSPEQLLLLLARFLMDYNDRPHQGLPIPGLSPNEFEKRIWLM